MKKGILTATFGACVLAFTLACGGLTDQVGGMGGGGGGAGNEEACARYVDHMNSLTCMGGVEYNKDDMCGMLDMSPVDMTEYYDCLIENSSCDGDIPKMSVEGCTMPTM